MPSQLADYPWERIQEFLVAHPNVYVGNADRCRQFIEAVHWMVRSGARWRFLLPESGGWNSVYKRFQRWCDNGVWEAMHRNFSTDADMEHVMIDSSIVRANACTAGAKGGQQNRALGRYRGGFSTKVHATVDALGIPIDFVLTGGEVHDVTTAPMLLVGVSANAVIADKACDSDSLLDQIHAQGATAVIPPRRNRSETREYDWHLYKERHLVECFFGKLKYYRRFFSRFDKTVNSYRRFLRFVSALIWLR